MGQCRSHCIISCYNKPLLQQRKGCLAPSPYHPPPPPLLILFYHCKQQTIMNCIASHAGDHRAKPVWQELLHKAGCSHCLPGPRGFLCTCCRSYHWPHRPYLHPHCQPRLCQCAAVHFHARSESASYHASASHPQVRSFCAAFDVGLLHTFRLASKE